jgi:hypothetical protein
MRNMVLGVLLIAGLWMAAVGAAPGRERLLAGQVAPVSPAAPVEASGRDIITMTTPVGDNRQMLTVVDTRTRVIG